MIASIPTPVCAANEHTPGPVYTCLMMRENRTSREKSPISSETKKDNSINRLCRLLESLCRGPPASRPPPPTSHQEPLSHNDDASGLGDDGNLPLSSTANAPIGFGKLRAVELPC